MLMWLCQQYERKLSNNFRILCSLFGYHCVIIRLPNEILILLSLQHYIFYATCCDHYVNLTNRKIEKRRLLLCFSVNLRHRKLIMCLSLLRNR